MSLLKPLQDSVEMADWYKGWLQQQLMDDLKQEIQTFEMQLSPELAKISLVAEQSHKLPALPQETLPNESNVRFKLRSKRSK